MGLTSTTEIGRLIEKARDLDALASKDWVAHTYGSLQEAQSSYRFRWTTDDPEIFANTFPRGCGALWHGTPGGGITGLPGLVEASADDVRFMEFARSFVPAAVQWIAAHLPEVEQRDTKAFGADLNEAENRLSLFGYENSAKSTLLLEAYRTAEIRRLEYKAFSMKNGRQLSEREQESDRLWAKRNLETLTAAKTAAALAGEARHALDAKPPEAA